MSTKSLSFRIVDLMRRFFNVFGIDLTIQRLTASRHFSFFIADPTCQIPNLASLYEQFFGRRSDGFVVEIGAFDGKTFSNSTALTSRGWSALLCEPVPQFAQLCRERYRNNERVEIVETAVGATSGTTSIKVAGALSTTNSTLATEYRSHRWSRKGLAKARDLSVNVVTLNELLSKRGVNPNFEVLIVDVEGQESEVFAGFDLAYWKPKMMIVELVDTHPDLKSTRGEDARLSRKIIDCGYGIVFKDSINTIFIELSVLRATNETRF